MKKQKKKTEYEQIRIAVVRDIAQRGWFNCLHVEAIREDGWVRADARWFSPDNVLWHGDFMPRPWDGNTIPPGTLCLMLQRWYPMEVWTSCIVLRHVKKTRDYQVLVGAETRMVSDQQIVPILSADSQQTEAVEEPAEGEPPAP